VDQVHGGEDTWHGATSSTRDGAGVAGLRSLLVKAEDEEGDEEVPVRGSLECNTHFLQIIKFCQN
jgi:hypothetical protein